MIGARLANERGGRLIAAARIEWSLGEDERAFRAGSSIAGRAPGRLPC